MGGRRTGGSGQSLCGMNRAAEGVAGGLGAVLGFEVGGEGPGWLSLVPGGHFHPSHAPSLSLTTKA